jgi:hypothetical protein
VKAAAISGSDSHAWADQEVRGRARVENRFRGVTAGTSTACVRHRSPSDRRVAPMACLLSCRGGPRSTTCRTRTIKVSIPRSAPALAARTGTGHADRRFGDTCQRSEGERKRLEPTRPSCGAVGSALPRRTSVRGQRRPIYGVGDTCHPGTGFAWRTELRAVSGAAKIVKESRQQRPRGADLSARS